MHKRGYRQEYITLETQRNRYNARFLSSHLLKYAFWWLVALLCSPVVQWTSLDQKLFGRSEYTLNHSLWLTQSRRHEACALYLSTISKGERGREWTPRFWRVRVCDTVARGGGGETCFAKEWSILDVIGSLSQGACKGGMVPILPPSRTYVNEINSASVFSCFQGAKGRKLTIRGNKIARRFERRKQIIHNERSL